MRYALFTISSHNRIHPLRLSKKRGATPFYALKTGKFE